VRRRITIEIYANDRTCGKCEHRADLIAMEEEECLLFHKSLEYVPPTECKRLDECLRAEREAAKP
jgi:hypothetical protein